MDTTPLSPPTTSPATPPATSPRGLVTAREFLSTTGWSALVAVAPLALQSLTVVARHGLDGEFSPNATGLVAAAALFFSTFAGLIARKFGQGPSQEPETPPQ